MLFTILQAIYFFLPAYVANMFPVFASVLKLPGGIAISKKNFGSHKTYRGFIAGIIGAVFIVYLQKLGLNNNFFIKLSILDYSALWWLYGLLFGFGALFGDLIKSFFKRRLQIKEGLPWFPFDQLDFVFGGLIFIAFIFIPSFEIIIILLVITPILHFLTNIIGYNLGLKNVWW